MNKLLKIQQRLIPQAIELMERRYVILRQISLSEPIGRRTLANILELSERIVRSETEFLKDQGFIDVAGSGMTIKQDGLDLLEELKDVMNDIMFLSNLQDRVKEKLGIKKVILAPGDFEKNYSVLKDVAKHAGEYFIDILKDKNIVSITGGSTMLAFANAIKTDKKFSHVTVVPARGSMGINVHTQSNHVAATVSKNLNCEYRLLNIPDELGEDAMKSLTQEPEIRKTLDSIEQTDILVFGIGRADEMAKRRNLPEEKVKEILSKGAVGEAFGHYFNKDGEIVYNLNTVGINLEIFKRTKDTIAVLAGKSKADALIAISKINKNLVLVCDEESAHKILELIS